MVRFYPPDAPVPNTITGEGFILRPLTVDHTALDYAAVMESRELLRRWSGSTWPGDGFTLQENRADLDGHQREHQARAAFTYTVLDPAATTCLGCVYIKPNNVPELNPRDDDALVRYWVRTSRQASGLDGRLLAALRDWRGHGFAFGRVFFHTNVDDPVQQALFTAAGLLPAGMATIPGRGGVYLVYCESPLVLMPHTRAS